MIKRDIYRDFRLITAPLRVLPDFIIPGESKCGTTSLYRYLTRHPDVFEADVKEPNNFIMYPQSGVYCKRHYPFIITRVFHNMISRGKFVAGEASAEYLSKYDVPGSIVKIVPDVKIIILMRNPVVRAYSDYQMLSNHGVIQDSFENVVKKSIELIKNSKLESLIRDASQIEHNPMRYIYRGIYINNVMNWLKYFPMSNFLFIKSEALFNNPSDTLRLVYEFMGLSRHELSDYPIKKMGFYNNEMSSESMKTLAEFYRPYNYKLYKLLGVDYGWESEQAETLASTE